MITTIVHWAVYAHYVYLFGYASLYKIFQQPEMMEGMKGFGFNTTWTLCIGYGELLGLIGLIVGLWSHEVKNIAVLWLFPFAVGALMVHFAHQEYRHFYGALFGCVEAIVLLATDKYFRIIL